MQQDSRVDIKSY